MITFTCIVDGKIQNENLSEFGGIVRVQTIRDTLTIHSSLCSLYFE